MITKLISLATGIASLDVYLQSQLHPGDPLFLFISNNILVNAVLLLLSASLIALSFKKDKKFNSWITFLACAAASSLLITFGAVGFLFSDNYNNFLFLLPLNYMLMVETGVIMALCTMSYEHQKVPYSLRVPLNTSVSFIKNAFRLPQLPSQAPRRSSTPRHA